MDKIGEALVELVKSGVPAAGHIATLYFLVNLLADIIFSSAWVVIFYLVSSFFIGWIKREYDYRESRLNKTKSTHCRYCGREV